MMKEKAWAGFALLFCLGLAGCDDVEKCKRGEDGCIDGKALNNTCKAGLVVVSGKCCESGQVVGDDGKCAKGSGGGGQSMYCAEADNVPQSEPVPPSCTDDNGDDLAFADACKAKCLQECMRAEVMCTGYTCDPSTCNGAAAQVKCRVECPSMDAKCMGDACKEIQGQGCTEFTCPMDSTRNCDEVHCSDTCSSSNIADGFCDDGHPLSASYSLCAYGTDCSDCGPRKGPRPARAPLGGLCVRDVGCEGYDDDYLKTKAWCVHVSGTPDGQFRCVPDCTAASGTEMCAEGFDCSGLVYSEDQSPVMMGNVQAHACFPTFCE